MKAVRILYRLSQFWRTLFPKTDSASLAEAQHQLTPVQRRLFGQLQPSEQKHALSIWRKLRDLGEDQPDLLVAALLHDVGKLHYPLHLWERVLVVLVRAVMPAQAVRWGSLPSNDWKRLPAWRKAFILAEQQVLGYGCAKPVALVGTLDFSLLHQELSFVVNRSDGSTHLFFFLPRGCCRLQRLWRFSGQ